MTMTIPASPYMTGNASLLDRETSQVTAGATRNTAEKQVAQNASAPNAVTKTDNRLDTDKVTGMPAPESARVTISEAGRARLQADYTAAAQPVANPVNNGAGAAGVTPVMATRNAAGVQNDPAAIATTNTPATHGMSAHPVGAAPRHLAGVATTMAASNVPGAAPAENTRRQVEAVAQQAQEDRLDRQVARQDSSPLFAQNGAAATRSVFNS
jgi:hypothetical protein